MMPKRSLDPKDIINLLSKLKEQTPEYPADMLEARKAAFLKQAANLKIQGDGNGGDAGNSGSGGSNAALGGGAASSGFLFQALVAFSVVAALLLTAFAYRKQISKIISGNELAAVEEISTSSLVVSTPTGGITLSPEVTPSATEPTPTGTIFVTTTGLENTIILIIDGTPVFIVDGTPDGTKTNPGLHLGQTPGTPAAPGQGNPGNVNQPDKPDNPNKPDKPGKPDKPPKEKNPNKP